LHIFLDLGRFSIIIGIYKRNSIFIMQINFTEFELETISAALDDYMCYDNEDLSEDDLIGGISVLDRVDSIQDKIDQLLTLNRG